MALFYERVSLRPGENAGTILDRYGIDQSRWPETRSLAQNSHAANAPITQGPPQLTWLCVPIDDLVTVVNYRVAKDTVNGLRPQNSAFTSQQRAAFAKSCAHGVDIDVERDGNPCPGLRWLQTVKKRNGVAFSGLVDPPEFVDTGGTGFPFYTSWIDPDSPDDVSFNDTPCGSAPVRMGQGLDFRATVSLVVWTPPRVTIAFGYTYHFQIGPAGAFWLIKPREATDAEYAEQIRILAAGIGELRQDSGKNLQYRKPPMLGSVNQ